MTASGVRVGLISKISGMSVLIAATAAAQTPAPQAAQVHSGLLSPSAFARPLDRPLPATPRAESRPSDTPRPSLLRQAQTITSSLMATSAPPPPRRRAMANWQKQVLFWGGVVGGIFLFAAWWTHE